MGFENFVYSNIYGFNPVFLISYSFVLVLLSVNTINSTVAEQNQALRQEWVVLYLCRACDILYLYNYRISIPGAGHKIRNGINAKDL